MATRGPARTPKVSLELAAPAVTVAPDRPEAEALILSLTATGAAPHEVGVALLATFGLAAAADIALATLGLSIAGCEMLGGMAQACRRRTTGVDPGLAPLLEVCVRHGLHPLSVALGAGFGRDSATRGQTMEALWVRMGAKADGFQFGHGSILKLGWESATTPREAIPDGLVVTHHLDAAGMPALKRIGKGLVVGGDLDLASTGLRTLPGDLVVGRHLDLRGCKDWDGILPDSVRVGGLIRSDFFRMGLKEDVWRKKRAEAGGGDA
jgi:hypothetical protein